MKTVTIRRIEPYTRKNLFQDIAALALIFTIICGGLQLVFYTIAGK